MSPLKKNSPKFTDLSKLKVSLTKHGAYKVYHLLMNFSIGSVLENVKCEINNQHIDIDRAQACKNLSATTKSALPPCWEKAVKLGEDHVKALTLIAIIFSHSKLINAFKNSSEKSEFSGKITRGDIIKGKSFTNLSNNLSELGFLTSATKKEVAFNLGAIFNLKDLAPLAQDIISLKLIKAGWEQKNSFLDEIKNLNIEDVFCVSFQSLSGWFQNKPLQEGAIQEDDLEYFFHDENPFNSGRFRFSPGHTPRKTESINAKKKARDINIDPAHNRFQEQLYKNLTKEKPNYSVGTEIPTGNGTYIDLVVEHRPNELYTFYEIKTDPCPKRCIRQALPQLLEYAYWTPREFLIADLIIVGKNKNTPDGEKYLQHLREAFGIPIHYQSIN